MTDEKPDVVMMAIQTASGAGFRRNRYFLTAFPYPQDIKFDYDPDLCLLT